MKQALKYILSISLISLLFVTVTSCANASGGGSPSSPADSTSNSADSTSSPADNTPSPGDNTPSPSEGSIQKQDFEVYDLDFNSLTYTLTARTSAPKGTIIAASANNNASTSIVNDEKAIWNMAKPFNSSVMGGKTYTITFSAEGYNDIKENITYMPKPNYELTCDDVEVIFNGSGDKYQLPEINLKNYDKSDVTVKWWFEIAGEKCNTAAFKSYVDNDENTSSNNLSTGEKTAYLHYELYPSVIADFTQGNPLYDSGSIKYVCKKESLVSYVRAEYKAGCYEAKTYDRNPDEGNAEEAGGLIFYQWQKSDTGSDNDSDWEIIEGEYGRFYKLKESDTGKYLRVQMQQILEHELLDDETEYVGPPLLTSKPTGKIKNGIKSASLYYANLTPVGFQFLPHLVTGKVTTIFGSTRDIDDKFKIESIKGDYSSMLASRYCDIRITHDDFEPFETQVYVQVGHVLKESELPSLSTQTDKISYGHVDFASINYDLEFSKDNKVTWTEMPSQEFTASVGDIFYIRKKATGTANTIGYIEESSPLSITVQANNIGKVVTGDSMLENLKYTSLKLSRSTKNGTITITPILSHKQEYYYQYGIDYEIGDTPLSDPSWQGKGIYKNENNCLVIEKDNLLGKDIYQINCVVEVYVEGEDEITGELEKEVTLYLSSQISLRIE